MIHRVALLVIGVATTVAALALDMPARFAVTWPAAFLTTLIAAGGIVVDAVPLRRVALACSAASLLCGLLLFLRAGVHLPLGLALVALQVVALAARRRPAVSPPGTARPA